MPHPLVPGLALTLLCAAAASPAAAQVSASASFQAQAQAQVGPSTGLAPAAPPPQEQEQPPAPPPPPATTVIVQQPPPPPPPPAEDKVEKKIVLQKPPNVQKKRRYRGKLGIHASLAGVMADDTQMGGFGMAFRYRPIAPIAFDFGIGIYGGENGGDEAQFGDQRREVPVSAEFMWFLKSSRWFQVYMMSGFALSFAETWHEGEGAGTTSVYSMQTLGTGIELRFGKWFALNGDIRGLLRERLGDDDEYVELDEDGEPTGRTAKATAGGLFTVGATFYFH